MDWQNKSTAPIYQQFQLYWVGSQQPKIVERLQEDPAPDTILARLLNSPVRTRFLPGERTARVLSQTLSIMPRQLRRLAEEVQGGPLPPTYAAFLSLPGGSNNDTVKVRCHYIEGDSELQQVLSVSVRANPLETELDALARLQSETGNGRTIDGLIDCVTNPLVPAAERAYLRTTGISTNSQMKKAIGQASTVYSERVLEWHARLMLFTASIATPLPTSGAISIRARLSPSIWTATLGAKEIIEVEQYGGSALDRPTVSQAAKRRALLGYRHTAVRPDDAYLLRKRSDDEPDEPWKQ